MIGLDIKVNQNCNRDLIHKILNGIEFKKYQWHIYADQILYKENKKIKQGIFNSHVLSGEEFAKSISRKGYWFIFVDVKAYKVGCEGNEINNFKDYINSNCELVFLCTDSIYVEIYCKDKNLLETIYNNCASDDFDSVQYISYDEALGRNLIAF